MHTQVMLLAQGHLVYSGPPQGVRGVLEGYGLPCPPDTSIAEHMLESVGNPSKVDSLLRQVGGLHQQSSSCFDGPETPSSGSA